MNFETDMAVGRKTHARFMITAIRPLCFPYNSGRQTVLLTSQLKESLRSSMTVGKASSKLRAGKLEGEEPEHRMISEIEEELGYRITELERVFELT